MDLDRYQEIKTEEYEIKPNKLVAFCILIQGVFGFAIWLMNEAGIFLVDKEYMRIVGFVSIILVVIPQLLRYGQSTKGAKFSKYIIIGCFAVNVLLLTTLLYPWAIILVVMPMFYSLAYTDKAICWMTYITAIITAIAAPAIATVIGAWPADFLIQWLRFAGVTVLDSAIVADPASAESIAQVVLYMSMPNVMLISVFFIFVHRFSGIRIDNAESKIKMIMQEERDPITGLFNRRSLIDRIKNSKNSFNENRFIVYADAHGLCNINQEHGYVAGDELLLLVARELTEAFGEEYTFKLSAGRFITVSFDKEMATVQLKLEKIRERIRQTGNTVTFGAVEALKGTPIAETIRLVEDKMQEDRRIFYSNERNDRRKNK